MIGQTVSHYKVLEKLGGGGMGVVYKAQDLKLDRPVALKFLQRHLETVEHENRFIREARAASALDHPNICTIYEIDKIPDGRMFIAMAFYEGETLKIKLQRGPLPVDQALDVCAQLAAGLSKAHEHGIVHRDIKPANVIVTADDSRVKILDFGLAKIAGQVGMTKSGIAVGTVAYMSPEQARAGSVDHRSDIWSVGVLLYEMLSGRLPFWGDSELDMLQSILHHEPSPLSSVRPGMPAELEIVIRKSLTKSPEKRYSSIQEMLRDMQGAGTWSQPTQSLDAVPAPSETPDAPVGTTERRQVTAIVCRLRGHTEMIENLPSSEVEDFLKRVRDAAERMLRQQGGFLNQFSGDQITILFGIPVSHEDDFIHAIRFILQLHQEVRQLSAGMDARTGCPVRMQSGVNCGMVLAERVNQSEYHVSGSTVQVAGRLSEEADEDEILVSPDCHRLIDPFFDTQALPAIPLKGKTEIVPYRILGESGLQTRLQAAERIGFTPFTGREKELALLRGSLESASRGEGRIVTVSGEVGIGKSRLLHEFRNGLDASLIRTVEGRCQIQTTRVLYLPFIEALKDLLELRMARPLLEHEITQKIREIDPALSDFLPIYLHLLAVSIGENTLPKHLQGEDLRLAIQEALTAIFTQSAKSKPLALFLEDWQWADDASQHVLRQMAEVLISSSVLMVVTYRPEPGVDLEKTLGEHTSLPLGPMDLSSSIAIIRSALQAEVLPEGIVQILQERTGGNAFFLEELCHAMREGGKIRIHGRQAVLTEELESVRLPESIEAVIRTRLDRLDFQDREVLRMASVIGREFTRPVLQRALSDSNPVRSLEALKSTGLIQQVSVFPEAAYRFKHILTQQVAYDSLLPHQRKVWHGVTGSILEEMYSGRSEGYSELLAHHYSKAENWEKAVHFGFLSARKANEIGQFYEALELMERIHGWLLNLPEDAARREKRIDLLLAQERLCETLGRREHQQKIIDELLGLLDPAGDRAAIFEVYCRQGDLFTLLGRYDEAEIALEKSLVKSNELNDPVKKRKALRSIGFLRWRQGKNEEAMEVNEQAVAIGRERKEYQEVAADLANLGNVFRHLEDYDRALMCLEEAMEIYEHHPDFPKQATTIHIAANIYRNLGQTGKACEYLQRALDISIKHRLIITQGFNLTALANIHWQLGRVEESLKMHHEALELNRRSRYADGLAQSLRNVGEILFASKREEEALPYFAESASVFSQLRDDLSEASVRANAAAIEERMNRYAEAERDWDRVRELKNRIQDDMGEIEALEGLARLIRLQGTDPDKAMQHFDRATFLARKLGDHAKEAALLNSMGIVEWSRGEYEKALINYNRALAIFQEIGDPVHEGFLLNSIGATHIKLGNYDDARICLEHAAEINRQAREFLLEGHSWALLGEMWQNKGDAEQALAAYETSLEIRRRIGDRIGEGWMLCRLAKIHADNGRLDQARSCALEAFEIATEKGEEKLKEACNKMLQAE